MNTIEIELRFEILNPSAISSINEVCTFQSEKRIVDCYLDTSSIDLLKKGIYIRIRDSRKIDIKFNRDCLNNPLLELQDSCEEYSFSLPLQQESLKPLNELLETLALKPLRSTNFEQFKQDNDLIEHRTVDKIRKTYATDQSFTLVIDEVKDLGLFLEIELLALPTENVEQTAQRMKNVLSSFDMLALKPLKTGYDSLMLRKHNFKEYIQGRFILDEDRQFRFL